MHSNPCKSLKTEPYRVCMSLLYRKVGRPRARRRWFDDLHAVHLEDNFSSGFPMSSQFLSITAQSGYGIEVQQISIDVFPPSSSRTFLASGFFFSDFSWLQTDIHIDTVFGHLELAYHSYTSSRPPNHPQWFNPGALLPDSSHPPYIPDPGPWGLVLKDTSIVYEYRSLHSHRPRDVG